MNECLSSTKVQHSEIYYQRRTIEYRIDVRENGDALDTILFKNLAIILR